MYVKTANSKTPFSTTNKSFVKIHLNNFRTKTICCIKSDQTFSFNKQKDSFTSLNGLERKKINKNQEKHAHNSILQH